MLQDFIEILILSAVQGISEFLPISSSAHLILVSNFYDLETSSLLIDISLHLGSLIAVIFYFRKELFDLRNNNRLLSLIIIGSLPLIFFGFILFFADQRKIDRNISTDLNIKSVLLIGLFQILALIPGVSRAGITITAARFLNFNRTDASKISFLLSIPALVGASFLGLREAFEQSIEINYLLLIATFLSFMFSFFTIKYFLKFISKISFNVFVIYRIILGLILFYIIYI